MIVSEVAKLNNADRLLYWISEREKVRLAKEAGKGKPWTDDTILQRFRFCNVRRMDDKVSRWLYDNWYKPHFDHPNMLLAAALARFINLPAALATVTKVVFSGKPTDKAVSWNDELIVKLLREYRDKGNTVFNGAYMVRGNDGMDKIDCVVNYYVAPLKNIGALDTVYMEHVWGTILESYGFGSFMAGQVVADLRWAMNGEWRDRNSWAPIGPGSLKGMNYLLGNEGKKPMSQARFLEELKKVKELCERKLPTSITSRLEMMDYQNVMCEFRAYHHALEGICNPKRRYYELPPLRYLRHPSYSLSPRLRRPSG